MQEVLFMSKLNIRGYDMGRMAIRIICASGAAVFALAVSCLIFAGLIISGAAPLEWMIIFAAAACFAAGFTGAFVLRHKDMIMLISIGLTLVIIFILWLIGQILFGGAFSPANDPYKAVKNDQQSVYQEICYIYPSFGWGNSSVLEDLAPGTYYLRYAGDANHNPSEDVAITIEGKTYWVVFDFNGGNCFGITEDIEVPLNIAGILTDNVPWPKKEGHTFLGYYTEDNVLIEDPENYTFTQTTHLIAQYAIKEYTVTVPAEQIGYKLETDVTKIEHGGEVYISFALKEGYKKARDFAVKVNGKKIELTEYNNVVVQATEDLVITVEGVILNSKQPNANPQTGDNSNMAQWLVLFLFSSSAIITLIGVDRKRRSAKRE
jgi:hypothetical protein